MKIKHLKIFQYHWKVPYLCQRVKFPRRWAQITMMGETPDRRHSVTPSTRTVSHRRSLLKGPAVQNIVDESWQRRKKCVRKRCKKQQRWPLLWEDCQSGSQSRFKNLGGELQKKLTEAEATRHRRVQETGHEGRRIHRVLLNLKSRFPESGGRLERHGSPVGSFHSQCDLRCGVISYCCWSTVFLSSPETTQPSNRRV